VSGEPESTPDLGAPQAVGRMLAGRYRIQRILGEGGMAVVYEGEHVAIGKRVAIKLVHSLFAKDDEIVGRFEREARSASAVESEHIVHVFDVGADPEFGLFLVMELLKGEDLAHVLAGRGKLDPVFACGLTKQAALGLEKAHATGIVHRDLKPANMFLVERDDGTTFVKLVDFGIAKVLREAQDARFARKGITRRGTAIGTPQYMSPEQAQGLETVDHRTDIFSLGAVLFEAIAGKPYMEERATYEQTILHLITAPVPRLRSVVPDVPDALDQLLADMMTHDPAARVQSMRTVRERLDEIYPELRGPSVKLKSLPPSGSSPNLDRYVVHHSASPMSPTLPGTSARISIPKHTTGRSVLVVAGIAALIGIGVGVVSLRHGPERPAAVTADPPRASALTMIPPPPATSMAPEPTSVPSTTASVIASTIPVEPGAPTGKPGKAAPARTAKPKDQVGSAGISSQF
jgi:eukaryotic-like serine/threonine-protein kinase